MSNLCLQAFQTCQNTVSGFEYAKSFVTASAKEASKSFDVQTAAMVGVGLLALYAIYKLNQPAKREPTWSERILDILPERRSTPSATVPTSCPFVAMVDSLFFDTPIVHAPRVRWDSPRIRLYVSTRVL